MRTAAASVITVSGPDDPAPPPSVTLQGPTADRAADRNVVSVGTLQRRTDPLATDILWDPGTNLTPIAVGPADDVSSRPTGAEFTASGPQITFDTAADAPTTAHAENGIDLLADPGVGAGEGFSAMSGSGSGGVGDLDIIASDGASYADAKEETHGGWVAVNNDNDNYNFDSDTDGKSLAHTRDLAEGGKVKRENDLVGIKFEAGTKGADPGGIFTVSWTSPNIKVYKSADKDAGLFKMGVDPVAVGQTLYVEGQSISTGPRDVSIDLNWKTLGPPAGLQLLDTVKFTVYEVNGAMNVPGYSIHTYEIRTPDARDSLISATSGGANNGGLIVNPVTFTTSRKILWEGGPALGTYRATPIVGEPFWSDREVNVVKVEQESAAGVNNALVYQNPPVQDPALPRAIFSVDALKVFAMQATLRVNKIEGPVVGGETKMRGVRIIDAGFVMNGKFTSKRGTFAFTPPRYSVSSLEYGGTGAEYYVDTANTPAAPMTTDFPWYYSKDGVEAGIPVNGLARPGIDPAAGAPASEVLTIWDRPAMFTTGSMSMTFGGVTKPVSQFSLIFDLNLYLAARTRDAGVGASTIFTQRAKADWQFNGSGAVDAAGKWAAGTTAKNSGKASFTAVSDGSVVPVTSGPEVNNLLPFEVWDERG